MNKTQSGQRQSYSYHEDTVGQSHHSLQRHMQRLSHLSQEDQATIMDAALAAAGHPKNQQHTGVRIFTTSQEHVWAIVAGRTVKTIMTTPNGTHLHSVSQCNRYAVVA